MRWLLPLVLMIAAAGIVSADYPELDDWFTDEVGLLSIDEGDRIWALAQVVNEETGAEMAILIVNTTQPDGIDLFAVKTFEENGIGREGKDDGVLILFSYSEKKWRIEVGYGLEGILPDALVNQLAREEMAPYLNQSMWFDAIYNITLAVGAVIYEDYDGDPPQRKDPWYPIPCLPLLWWQLLIVIAIVVVLMVVTKGRGLFWILWILSFGKFGGGGGGGFGGGRSGGGGASGRF